MTQSPAPTPDPNVGMVSPDGAWTWNGTEWVATATHQARPPVTNAGGGGKNVAKWVGIGVGVLFVAFMALAALGALVGEPVATDATGEPVATAPEQPDEEAAAAEAAAAEKAAAEEAAAQTPYGVYPSDQKKFVTTVENARDEIEATDNDLKQSAALRQRDRNLAAILGSGLGAENWVGTISDVGANGEGKAYVDIEIADNVRVVTWNNFLSDIGDDTLIPESSKMFDNLLELEVGDRVVFSGKFFRGSDTALKGTNLTDTFYGYDPKFLFKFSAIKAG